MVERLRRLDASTPFTIAIDAQTADEVHELRVIIPAELHRQLVSLKVLRGRSLAQTVSAALDLYFARLTPAHPERREADSAT